jgi:phosphate-selective porin OprO/OprP
MVGYAGWTMERQMAIDVIPILADGIKLMGFLEQLATEYWSCTIGCRKDTISPIGICARFGWLPYHSEQAISFCIFV